MTNLLTHSQSDRPAFSCLILGYHKRMGDNDNTGEVTAQREQSLRYQSSKHLSTKPCVVGAPQESNNLF